MKLSKKARKALWESIEHWLENWEHPETASIYSNSCPLCLEYLNSGGRCKGCPIKKTTGNHECVGTPWERVNAGFIYRLDGGTQWNLDISSAQGRIEELYRFLVDIALDDEFGFAPEE